MQALHALCRPAGTHAVTLLQVDVVIVSSCCFTPTPSHAAMIVNHFKMREDVLTYNLGGMGCAASVVCADLAQHLLKAIPLNPKP